MCKEKKIDTLKAIAEKFRCSNKKSILIFAHNGTGKTRLSVEFKNLGKRKKDKEESIDTLYFNAYTQDLFTWDNDLENNERRVIKLHKGTNFFNAINSGLDLDNKIRMLLHRYADFDFKIDAGEQEVSFYAKNNQDKNSRENNKIKVSRGEENIFIWCFFLAIAQLAICGHKNYTWVKYIYIDDPISSLDDNNAITMASHLAQIIKNSEDKKFIISTHHGLFYNVLYNELKNKTDCYFFSIDKNNNTYALEHLRDDTPFYQHLSMLQELDKVVASGNIYTYHFNQLRNVLEKTAAFLGFKHFSDCIEIGKNDIDKIIHTRRVNVLSHGNHSIFEPVKMPEESKEHFRDILSNLIIRYQFNKDLFDEPQHQKEEPHEQ